MAPTQKSVIKISLHFEDVINCEYEKNKPEENPYLLCSIVRGYLF